MHLLLVGLGPSLSHGKAYSKLQDTPVSIPKLSSVPIQLQMGHLDQDTSSDDHHWPPAQQSSSSSYTGMVSTSSGYSLLSNFRSWSVNIWREHPNLTKNYLTASMAVTSVLLDTIHLLSELIHHKQNIPGTHSPSESKIVPEVKLHSLHVCSCMVLSFSCKDHLCQQNRHHLVPK